MFREFIVDGYNLLHKLFPEKAQGSLQHKREKTERMLLGFQQSTRWKVTIVYDGQHSRAPFQDSGALNRVFTASGGSADEWIIDYLKSLGSNAQMFTIISSDRFICRHASARGASYMLSEDFIRQYLSGKDRRNKTGKNGSNKEKSSDVSLSRKEVDHWLSIFGKTEE